MPLAIASARADDRDLAAHARARDRRRVRDLRPRALPAARSDRRARVPRVRALDRHGKRFELELKDFAARVVQHENDHLDGVLFFDRMKTLESLTYLEEFSRYHARREDED